IDFLGMNSDKTIITVPATSSSSSVVPIEAFCKLLEQKLVYAPHERDMVMMSHEFDIEWPSTSGSGGKRKLEKRTSSLVSYGGDGSRRVSGIAAGGSGLTGYSSMARTVGLPIAIAARMVLSKRIGVDVGSNTAGVVIPTTSVWYKPVLAELK